MKNKNFVKTLAVLGLMASMAMPAFASTTSTSANNTAAVACVGGAVSTREQALDNAMTTYTASLNAAFSARSTALQAAYAQTGGNGAIKSAVKAAWSTFSATKKSAHKTWVSARNSAWAAFRTSAKSCKAPAAISDNNNASADISL